MFQVRGLERDPKSHVRCALNDHHSHCGPIHYVQESGLRVGTANCAPEVSKLMVAAWLNLGPLVKLLNEVYPLQMMKADVVQIPVRSGRADLSLPGIMDFFHFLGKKVRWCSRVLLMLLPL